MRGTPTRQPLVAPPTHRGYATDSYGHSVGSTAQDDRNTGITRTQAPFTSLPRLQTKAPLSTTDSTSGISTDDTSVRFWSYSLPMNVPRSSIDDLAASLHIQSTSFPALPALSVHEPGQTYNNIPCDAPLEEYTESIEDRSSNPTFTARPSNDVRDGSDTPRRAHATFQLEPPYPVSPLSPPSDEATRPRRALA